jgi:NitT/TauT family transport system substrate-binding protein
VLGLVALCAGTLAFAGCTPATPPASAAKPSAVRIGTLATQDSLPLWVAQDKGYFTAAGIPKVEIVPFQSAQECQAAFSSGAVDALMTDLIVSANLRASGTKVIIPTVMLGADTAQGRFAVVAAPKTEFASMKDLAGVPVGAASSTITEYVLDKLMEEAGVAAADVKIEQVPKMPVRFQLLMAGQLKAASLPEPFVTLATMQGATVIPGGDDTLAAKPEGGLALEAMHGAWDKAVADINAAPDSFRTTLVTKANLPTPLATSYKVSSYPKWTPPSAADIDRVLEWMRAKGYLKAEVTAEELLSGK